MLKDGQLWLSNNQTYSFVTSRMISREYMALRGGPENPAEWMVHKKGRVINTMLGQCLINK